MGFRLTLFTCTTHSVSYIKALIYILLLEKYNKIHWIFLTWYQSHCSKPLVSFTSWVSFTATVVVNTTTASTATAVHQRPLPCRHHRFHFSDQTTGCTIREDSLWFARLWKIVFIEPITHPPAPLQVWATSTHPLMRHHSPSRTSMHHHAPNLHLLTSSTSRQS